MSGLTSRESRLSYSEYMEQKKLRSAETHDNKAMLSAEEATAILQRAQAIAPPSAGKDEQDSDDDSSSPFAKAAEGELMATPAEPTRELSPEEANAILARAQAIAPTTEKNWKSSWTFGLLS